MSDMTFVKAPIFFERSILLNDLADSGGFLCIAGAADNITKLVKILNEY